LKKKIAATAAIAAIAATGLLLSLMASGVLVSSQTLQTTGIVAAANIGAYSDYACTQSLTSISWGTVSPGSSITRTVYVKNTGNAPLSVSLTKTNWTPTNANGPITLTWDLEGVTLNANQVVAALLTLSLSSGISGVTTFSFNIVISGTG
jgi:hypothetical protein